MIFDLNYDLAQVGDAGIPGPGTVTGLADFSFLGGDFATDTRHVAMSIDPGVFAAVCAPNVIPVSVPLDPFSVTDPGPVAVSVPLESALPTLEIGPVSADQGTSAPVIPVVDTGAPSPSGEAEIGPLSSADVQRIKEEGREERAMKELGSCDDEDRLEWLERGARSAARDLDWGRRSGVGTDPEATDDVFRQGGCYFTDA